MSDSREFDERGVYQIRVKGVLAQEWSDWFDGFAIVSQADDETLLTGPGGRSGRAAWSAGQSS